MGLLNFFSAKRKSTNCELGLTLSEQGIFVAHFDKEGKLITAIFEPGKWLNLAKWIEQQKLQGTKVFCVLNWDSYSLYQVEPPSVPEEEMNQALLFSLRDRINFPITEGHIDSFPMPKNAQRSNQSRINVVVAHLPLLQNITQGVRAAGLLPKIISVPELELGHFISDHPDMKKGLCIIAYRDEKITLMIYREDELYVSRTLTSINNWQKCLQPDSYQAAENLVLEIQRTLDYYQSQMAQPPVAKVLLPDWSEPLEPLLQFLGDNLGTNVELLEVPKSEIPVSIYQQQTIALAIAGAQSAKR